MATLSPLERLSGRAAYAAAQGARVAWYMGHGLLMRRLREAAGSTRAPRATRFAVPQQQRVMADMRQLFLRDLANVEAGYYPRPRDRDGVLPDRLARSGEFFADLSSVHARREAGRHSEVLNERTRGKRPRYYLQNFHFQSGGWMSEGSARIYDTQVEVLFNGSANAMRRQLLVPIARFVRGCDQRQMKLVDLGCGTGRFLGFVAEAFPRLDCLGVDLSDTYLAEAGRHLKRRGHVRLALAKAEALPLRDESVDAIAAVFLFHELPPKIRREAMCEVRRVLKPGGRFFLLDTLQLGDAPDYDGLLDLFPRNFHEPYYAGYIREDLDRLGRQNGLALIEDEPVFMTKISVFEKAP